MSVIDRSIDKLEANGEGLGLRRRFIVNDDELMQLMTKVRESDEMFGKIENRSTTPRRQTMSSQVTSEEVCCLLGKMRASEEHNSAQQETIAMLTSENSQLRTLITANEEAHNIDRENYFTATNELSIRNQLLESLQGEASALTTQAHSLELELSKSEKIRIRQRAELSSHLTVRANQETVIQKLEKKLNLNLLATLEEAVSNLTVDNTALAEQHFSISCENNKMSALLQQMQQDIDSATHRNIELQETSESCVREYRQVREQLMELQAECKFLRHQKGAVQSAEFQQLLTEHGGLQADYQSLKVDYTGLLNENQSSRLQEDQNLLSKYALLQTDIQHLENENIKLRDERNQVDDQFCLLRKQMASWSREESNYQKLFAKYAHLRTDFERLEKENIQLKKQSMSARESDCLLSDIQSKLKHVEDENIILHNERSHLKEQLAKCKDMEPDRLEITKRDINSEDRIQYGRLEEENATMRNELSNAASTIRQLQTELTNQLEEVTSLRSENGLLTGRCQRKIEKYEQLQSKFITVQSENERMKKEQQSAQQSVPVEEHLKLAEQTKYLSQQYDDLLANYISLQDVRCKDDEDIRKLNDALLTRSGNNNLSQSIIAPRVPQVSLGSETFSALVSDIPTAKNASNASFFEGMTKELINLTEQFPKRITAPTEIGSDCQRQKLIHSPSMSNQFPYKQLFSDDVAGTPAPTPQSADQLPHPCKSSTESDIYISNRSTPTGVSLKDDKVLQRGLFDLVNPTPKYFPLSEITNTPVVNRQEDLTSESTFLGLVLNGSQVVNVKVGCSAYRCGIRKGDNIVSIAGYHTTELLSIQAALLTMSTVQIATNSIPSGVDISLGKKPKHCWVPSSEKHLTIL